MLIFLGYLTSLVCCCVGLQPGIYGNAGEDYIAGNNALALYDPKTGNVTTISKAPTGYNSITESDLAAVDLKNQIYVYYTENITYNPVTTHSVFGAYNLLNPSEDQYVLALPSCVAEMFVGAGLSFDYNDNDGNLYVWCPDSKNNSTQDLLRLTWNPNKNNFDTLALNTYNFGNNPAGYPLFSVIDSKRDFWWVSDPSGGLYMFYTDLKTGNFTKKMSITDWKSVCPIYSESRDAIVSSISSVNEQKVIQGMNITFADPETGEIDQSKTVNVKSLDQYKYVREFYPPVYTMDDEYGIWYQLMWKYVSYGSYTIDLISINIFNGELLNDPVQICTYGQQNETCPKSIIYLRET